ncbi:UDP-N-acetylmuramoylalanyl-D-glutamate--2,6-diaminopimelate ligase [Porphyromonadaceae bacterium COT-184 OH4590]|nr:UDP-N-acetylmuramoylalanyl-D-glutamate--2,6-diaminopimelate ligase [Porphyromonadaceae bacterium COT-184 OH4590]
MLISKVLANIATIKSYSNDVEINNITDDSRKVVKGDLFVAVCGVTSDGHNFIERAVKNGAVAVVVNRSHHVPCLADYSHVQVIEVDDSAKALGEIASNFYDHPSQKLYLVGVTGTNGKTTTATLLYNLFLLLGFKTGLLSTIRNYICQTPIETINTTPNVLETNRLLAEMVTCGCSYCFMEVSSHATIQQRIAGLHFAGAIFTNLTQDHLDYHETMDNYRYAKKLFFDHLPPTAFAITNLDDRNGMFMLQNTKATKITYSTRSLADFKTKIIENTFDGMTLTMEVRTDGFRSGVYEMVTPFAGSFNAQNLTAVFGAAALLCKGLNIDNQTILTALSGLRPVSGRFEMLHIGGIAAIVDYAHTPDALKNVLSTINDIKGADAQVITVVGCGGDRDKTKRPIMAQIAANESDTIVLTSDNPRTENPQDILDDMLGGLNKQQTERTIVIPDRRQAIKTACKLAKRGDVVLIAGKGHENYQIIGKNKHHFDDKEEVINYFEQSK